MLQCARHRQTNDFGAAGHVRRTAAKSWIPIRRIFERVAASPTFSSPTAMVTLEIRTPFQYAFAADADANACTMTGYPPPGYVWSFLPVDHPVSMYCSVFACTLHSELLLSCFLGFNGRL